MYFIEPKTSTLYFTTSPLGERRCLREGFKPLETPPKLKPGTFSTTEIYPEGVLRIDVS